MGAPEHVNGNLKAEPARVVDSPVNVEDAKSGSSTTQVTLPKQMEDALHDLREQFTIDTAKLKEIVGEFEKELIQGLEKPRQNIAMYPTWVFGFPTGQERGQYLTIDLGGTNLRVCWITLHGQGEKTDVEQDMYKLPEEIKTGTAEELWDLIAECLEKFIDKHQLQGTKDEPLPLGFTFSYPVEQDAVDQGTLVTWTKGFNIAGVEGQDVVVQLAQAFNRRRIPVKIIALVNDTVGALIASAYNDPETKIGAIFGTGCNAAYMENVGSIPKIKGCGLPPETHMTVNCEYGAFDNAHRILPRTKYDIQIDKDSPKPDEQAFEKMSAGLYLGEIFRLVILDFHDRGLLFKGHSLSDLKDAPYALDTGFLSCLENDSLDERRVRFQETAALGFAPTAHELEFCRLLAEMIALRGARLCACGIAAICDKKKIRSGHVAADGSVANKHPRFKARWRDALGEILGRSTVGAQAEDPITLHSAEDGSGIGAAIVTAMTMKNIREGNPMGVREGGPFLGKQ